MILVFGGTTEGKKVITVLESLQLSYVYSTKTEINVELGKKGNYRFGAFSEDTLKEFIRENIVSLIIHASHPFAEELHATIDKIAYQTKTPVLRLERTYPRHTNHHKVHYVEGYAEALTLLQEKFDNKRLLALTGVQSIEKLKRYWKKNTAYFRVLDRKSSVDLALASGFLEEHLILGLPNKTVDAEFNLLTDKKIEVIITKESGDSGSLSIKIEAALKNDSSIIIIKRPIVPTSFNLVTNTEKLIELLTLNSKLWV